MRRGTLRNSAWTVAAFGIAVVLMACGSSSDDPNSTGGNNPNNPNNPNNGQQQPKTPEEQVKQILDARQYDYGEAARTASLKLRDELPSLDEIKQFEGTDNAAKKAAYEKLIDTWVNDPKFNKVMVKFWKDTFRTAQVGQIQQNKPDMDKAANFAARLVVEGKPYTDLFTATTNTCPTFDMTAGTFTDGSCATTPTAGVLTDPGLMSQYFSNMAMRRARFIQETFACSKYPAEFSKTPVPMGNGTYTGIIPFDSLVGKKNTPNARIDFQDTQAVICANCHANINQLVSGAQLFLWDANGMKQATSQVDVPIPGNPKAAAADYLVAGTQTKWRASSGENFTDIVGLGASMAKDPEVSKCAVNRVWNYAMSRGDIVNDLATVPDAVTDAYVKSFTSGGHNLKETIKAVFKSEDFTKF